MDPESRPPEQEAGPCAGGGAGDDGRSQEPPPVRLCPLHAAGGRPHHRLHGAALDLAPLQTDPGTEDQCMEDLFLLLSIGLVGGL